MKKTLIALAALGAIAGAHAQSTVTIYGLLDANIISLKTNVAVNAAGVPVTAANAATATSIQHFRQGRIDSGGLNGSRWGIRVNEDLGGGLAAVGNLESGVNLDNGSSAQGGLLFGRRANVGVSSTSFGTVTIGRNSSSYDDVSGDHTMMSQTLFDPSNNNNGFSVAQAQNVTSLANASAFLGNRGSNQTTWIGYNTRFNNSVKYITPNFSGFSASAMFATGEDKTLVNSASKTVSANLKYANGPLLISGGYQSEAAGGTLGTASLVGTGGGKPALQNGLLSVAYDFGVAKIGAGFNRAKFKDVAAPAILGGGSFDAQKEVSLSVAVPLGATTLSASVARSKGDTLGKSTGFGVQALYSLSKRSTLYAGAATTKGYDKLVDAVNLAAPGSAIEKTISYGVGIRHTF